MIQRVFIDFQSSSGWAGIGLTSPNTNAAPLIRGRRWSVHTGLGSPWITEGHGLTFVAQNPALMRPMWVGHGVCLLSHQPAECGGQQQEDCNDVCFLRDCRVDATTGFPLTQGDANHDHQLTELAIQRLFVPRHPRCMDAFTRLEVRYIFNSGRLVCRNASSGVSYAV